MKCFYLLLTIVSNEPIIRNINFPSCKKCIYYQPNFYESDFTSTFSKCQYFGSKDIINGDINYDFANLVRRDQDKCGEIGKYFKEEPNLKLKIWKHNALNNLSMKILLISTIGLWVITIYNYTK